MAQNNIVTAEKVADAVEVVRVVRMPFSGPSGGALKEGQIAYKIYRGNDESEEAEYYWAIRFPELDVAFNIFQKEKEDMEADLQYDANAREEGKNDK